MPSQIRVDSITDLSGTGPVELTYGGSLPTGSRLTVNGNVNITGVSTVGFLSATNAEITGVVTATAFVGDGSGLTGVQSVGEAKSIAFAIIGS